MMQVLEELVHNLCSCNKSQAVGHHCGFWICNQESCGRSSWRCSSIIFASTLEGEIHDFHPPVNTCLGWNGLHKCPFVLTSSCQKCDHNNASTQSLVVAIKSCLLVTSCTSEDGSCNVAYWQHLKPSGGIYSKQFHSLLFTCLDKGRQSKLIPSNALAASISHLNWL